METSSELEGCVWCEVGFGGHYKDAHITHITDVQQKWMTKRDLNAIKLLLEAATDEHLGQPPFATVVLHLEGRGRCVVHVGMREM
jgi:hypothetical protein